MENISDRMLIISLSFNPEPHSILGHVGNSCLMSHYPAKQGWCLGDMQFYVSPPCLRIDLKLKQNDEEWKENVCTTAQGIIVDKKGKLVSPV